MVRQVITPDVQVDNTDPLKTDGLVDEGLTLDAFASTDGGALSPKL